mmetsp:Transcript_34032/g.101681  ORF Transcript_34032/g.101681 Transcript_34032/m.101681 type:complete len:177 (-) Transcript_34032:251-781(-)
MSRRGSNRGGRNWRGVDGGNAEEGTTGRTRCLTRPRKKDPKGDRFCDIYGAPDKKCVALLRWVSQKVETVASTNSLVPPSTVPCFNCECFVVIGFCLGEKYCSAEIHARNIFAFHLFPCTYFECMDFGGGTKKVRIYLHQNKLTKYKVHIPFDAVNHPQQVPLRQQCEVLPVSQVS